MDIDRIWKRLNLNGVTGEHQPYIRGNFKQYEFTAEEWGIADLDHDGTDVFDLNHRLSFTLYQLKYSQECQLDVRLSIRRRMDFFVRYLQTLGIDRRAPLELIARTLEQELNLDHPVGVPGHPRGDA